MDPFTVGALVSAAGSVINGVLSNSAAKEAQNRSIAAQSSLQSVLMNGGAQMARTAKQAGLSPSFALGSASTPVASAVSPVSHPYPDADIAGGMSKAAKALLGKKQAKLEEVATDRAGVQLETDKEQKRLVAAEADKAEIEANRMAQHDHEFTWVTTSTYNDPETGEPISDIDKWSHEHPGMLPNLEPHGEKSSYGAFLAKKEKENRNLELDDIRTKYLANDLQRKVHNLQLSDGEVLLSIASLPLYQQKEVVSRINDINSAINQRNYQNAVYKADEILRYFEANKVAMETELQGVEKDSEEYRLLSKKLGDTNQMLHDVYNANSNRERAIRVLKYFSAKGDNLIDMLGSAAGGAVGAYAGARVAKPKVPQIKGFSGR